MATASSLSRETLQTIFRLLPPHDYVHVVPLVCSAWKNARQTPFVTSAMECDPTPGAVARICRARLGEVMEGTGSRPIVADVVLRVPLWRDKASVVDRRTRSSVKMSAKELVERLCFPSNSLGSASGCDVMIVPCPTSVKAVLDNADRWDTFDEAVALVIGRFLGSVEGGVKRVEMDLDIINRMRLDTPASTVSAVSISSSLLRRNNGAWTPDQLSTLKESFPECTNLELCDGKLSRASDYPCTSFPAKLATLTVSGDTPHIFRLANELNLNKIGPVPLGGFCVLYTPCTTLRTLVIDVEGLSQYGRALLVHDACHIHTLAPNLDHLEVRFDDSTSDSDDDTHSPSFSDWTLFLEHIPASASVAVVGECDAALLLRIVVRGSGRDRGGAFWKGRRMWT
ncbi:hypothetical protein M427DRAFT_64367 [Gonapodya prolifera JEL478]|uniref:F-box domain-containing protein n=1 Tax=Gonapodya prolifera (strain JEL478) TaxID=1344416 RepID=A0A138ZXS1_GONPJ|nr:hypothetical protein M427DRAFT_64367 [Gonapodya prolifera JEL478]|eukprot:KXS09259.1 hypothetical protein M427DRAFT_64367 [Gonapodya prolifera JEL478]